MAQHLRLFAGHPQVLMRYRSVLPDVVLHTLTAGATFAVLSLDDDRQDSLHQAYGTGEWPDSGASLTTTDSAFAARASEAGALAYIETNYFGGAGGQCAMLWRSGNLIAQPAWLERTSAVPRPRATWPINAALRGLGVVASEGRDEFDTLGLGLYRRHEDILARALPLRA